MTQPRFYLSDVAYDYLVLLGKAYDYIPPDNPLKQRGITEFVRALSTIPPSKWEDNRPTYNKINDYSLLKAGQLPEWTLYYPARPRVFYLTFTQINAYLDIALAFGIPARQHRTPYSITAAVLEAIGIEWLVPLQEIPKGKWATKHHYKKVPVWWVPF